MTFINFRGTFTHAFSLRGTLTHAFSLGGTLTHASLLRGTLTHAFSISKKATRKSAKFGELCPRKYNSLKAEK